MASPQDKWEETYSPDKLWRETLRYRNGVLVSYTLEKRETSHEIVWSIWARLEMHPRTKYLFTALRLRQEENNDEVRS